MEPYLVWLIAGFALAIAELLTGTFYLLMLAAAAFGAGAIAWTGQGFAIQAMVAGGIAAAGCWGVHIWHSKNAKEQMAPIDAGQPATFESWTDVSAGLARVRYRGASWDAQFDVNESGALDAGTLVYVSSTLGNTLQVTRRRRV